MISLNFGVVSTGRVSSALTRILPQCETTWAAIIRGIDSTRSRDGLTKVLVSHHVSYDVVNGNVCVSIASLQQCLERRLFTGFDEIWFFSCNLPPFDLASAPSATSDAANFSLTMPEELLIAIEKTSCIAVLADGCGLNYAVTDERILEEIMKREPRKANGNQ
jgi:hypothetical protein